jgi:hypothetical protein
MALKLGADFWAPHGMTGGAVEVGCSMAAWQARVNEKNADCNNGVFWD